MYALDVGCSSRLFLQGVRLERINVLVGSPYEEIVGVSPAVRVGPFVAAGGTAPVGVDGATIGVGDIEAQARRCFEIVGEALERTGAGWPDVVRVRNLLTRIEHFEKVIAVRREFVGASKPVDRMKVSRFVNPEWLIEIEVDAVIAASNTTPEGN